MTFTLLLAKYLHAIKAGLLIFLEIFGRQYLLPVLRMGEMGTTFAMFIQPQGMFFL